jgi:hypothetical protein
MEDRRLTVKQIAANAGISVGSVDTILHDDLCEKRPRKAAALLFHHDNSPPHRAACVHQFFDDNNFEVVSHAPYSPAFAIFVFPTLKETSWSHIFKSLLSCNSDFPVITTNP